MLLRDKTSNVSNDATPTPASLEGVRGVADVDVEQERRGESVDLAAGVPHFSESAYVEDEDESLSHRESLSTHLLEGVDLHSVERLTSTSTSRFGAVNS